MTESEDATACEDSFGARPNSGRNRE
jgi:hypothetical protein